MIDFTNIATVLSFSLAVVFMILCDIVLFRIFVRRFVLFYIVGLEAALVVAWVFKLDYFAYVVFAALVVGVIAFFYANLNAFRNWIANSLKGKTDISLFSRKRTAPEALFDREEMYGKINNAVAILSKQKIGAIITFERKDSLNDVMKSGTIINAPVSSELLQTIFYEGTRLHDGAVIIRNDTIVAASVYFTPTTKPLIGKYGSRHRAAIGISETTDSVTVVVSEETGRISIAFQGELQSVTSDAFLKTFEDYMAIEPSEDGDETPDSKSNAPAGESGENAAKADSMPAPDQNKDQK